MEGFTETRQGAGPGKAGGTPTLPRTHRSQRRMVILNLRIGMTRLCGWSLQTQSRSLASAEVRMGFLLAAAMHRRDALCHILS
jgi:hypothetical protein